MECDVNWSGQENAVYKYCSKTGTNRKRKLNNDAVSMDVKRNVLTSQTRQVKDCTSDIRRAHNTGKVYYPNEHTYLTEIPSFAGESGLKARRVLIRNSIAEQPVMLR